MAGIARDTLIDSRYRVVRRLGTGGMAEVFLAEDEQLGRKVALKLLHRRFAEDPGFVERFRREAQAAAGLQHQNVVSVYDRGEFEDTYYIAMEYLPGRSLKQLIRDESPLDPVRAIDIAIQILRAARFAHRRGIIHRDLKPHNVIVDDSDHAKVTDFGIARAGASDMTETGSIRDRPIPVPRAGSGPLGQRPIGPVLGRRRALRDAHRPRAVRRRLGGDDRAQARLRGPAAAVRFNPKVTPELEQTVLWTLNKNPADRPADAEQLITVLEHCREAILAGQAGQHTASMAAVAAGAAAGMPVEGMQQLQPQPRLGVGESTTARGRSPPSPSPGAGEPEPRRRKWLPWVLGAPCCCWWPVPPGGLLPQPAQAAGRTASSASRSGRQGDARQRGPLRPPRSEAPSQAPGIVIDADPSVGSKVDKGSTVTLTVSTGRSNVFVPNVQGESQKDATADAEEEGAEGHAGGADASIELGADAQAIKTSPAARQASRATPT